jgi:ribonuclease Y
LFISIVAFILFNVGIVVGWFIAKAYAKNQYKEFELEAKAKASVIEKEAQRLLAESKSAIQEEKLKLKNLEDSVKSKHDEIERTLRNTREKEERLDELISKNRKLQEELGNKLSSVSSMTKEEARKELLEIHRKEIESDIAKLTRKQLIQAKESAKQEANYLLAQAVTRYAGDFAGERLVNSITLPNDDHKGKIIGKDGRNIKALEQLLGVDIIVDDTPGVILVSNFNLYRRAIAVEVIERLIDDGRIHPARIEEVIEKVQCEFEEKLYQEGEKVVVELGLYPMHEELIRLLGRMKYRASYGQNALLHSLEVARLSKSLAAEMGGDEKLALRAGLLHDIGKSLTQDFDGNHVDLGAEICRKYNEHPVVINAIYAHHGYEEPTCIESAAVCTADVLSAARPGARREVLESFTKRVKELENIALAHDGVMKAYAINAGREIRIFIDANRVSDEELPLLTHKIAKEIEEKLQFPGEIKVNAIRETKFVEYAK